MPVARIDTSELVAFERALRALGRGPALRAVRNASTPEMRRVRREAKQRAPRGTGTLARSLGIRAKTYGRRGFVFTTVGPRSDYSRNVGRRTLRPVRYAHHLELGTRYQRAQPFLRPALEGNRQSIVSGMARNLRQQIPREMRRAARRAARNG